MNPMRSRPGRSSVQMLFPRKQIDEVEESLLSILGASLAGTYKKQNWNFIPTNILRQ